MREDTFKFQIGHLVDSADFQLGRIMDRQYSYSFPINYYFVDNKWVPEWRLTPSFSKGDKVLITNGIFKGQIGTFEKYTIDNTTYVLAYVGNTLISFHIDNITRPDMETQNKTQTQKPAQQVIASSIEVVKKTAFEGEYISIPKADFNLLMIHYKNNTMKVSDKLTEMFQRWQNS